MRDVAVASGVSPSTVSFVLNGVSNQTIPEATRERVERAAAELNYVPHGIARALREGSSRIVLLELDPLFRGGSADSFVRGLDSELALHSHALLVRYAKTTAATAKVAEALQPRAVISLVGVDGLASTEPGDGGLPAHSRTQIAHLVERGHRHIAIALPDDAERARLADARFRFGSAAAESLGLAVPQRLEVASTMTDAATALRALRRDHPQITAIAAFDDTVALSVLAVARELGLNVPGDLAVIGFDATEHTPLSVPSLTTVQIDAESYGRITARHTLGLAASDIASSEARVIERESA